MEKKVFNKDVFKNKQKMRLLCSILMIILGCISLFVVLIIGEQESNVQKDWADLYNIYNYTVCYEDTSSNEKEYLYATETAIKHVADDEAIYYEYNGYGGYVLIAEDDEGDYIGYERSERLSGFSLVELERTIQERVISNKNMFDIKKEGKGNYTATLDGGTKVVVKVRDNKLSEISITYSWGTTCNYYFSDVGTTSFSVPSYTMSE